MVDETSGLKRPKEAPVDIFTLKPEPELLGDAEAAKEEKLEPIKEVKEKTTTRPKPAEDEPAEDKPAKDKKDENKNTHVSLYIPSKLVERLDALKHRERYRLRKKVVTRSTLIHEAIERYLKYKKA